MTNSDSLVKKIAENAIVAAIYFVLTICVGLFPMTKSSSGSRNSSSCFASGGPIS
jgi:uncharacterized membrane protein